MLRVAEQYAGTDTGRQRRANEDSLLARAPLFVVADGMGGAQAGEVASRIAVESFQPGLARAAEPELELAELARTANSRIHELSHSNAEHAGMGTTLTAVYVGEQEIAIAHVGDSRAYCLRDGELLRLTDDHSLVDELLRQGRLTPEEAVEHPQRSVITRALGPEGSVDVDTRSFRARADDVYLLCSDGLTTMIPEQLIARLLIENPRLRDAGEALIAAANEAGGRDNITVLLLRLEEVAPGQAPAREHDTFVGAAAAEPPAAADSPAAATALTTGEPRSAAEPLAAGTRAPLTPRSPAAAVQDVAAPRRRAGLRRAGALVAVLVVLGMLGAAAYVAVQSVYFVGTNGRGLVTMYRGLPIRLPGNLALYSSDYVSGVSAASLSAQRRRTLLEHSLRSEADAASLIRSLELDQLE
jgi:PPM family protein phosphatase